MLPGDPPGARPLPLLSLETGTRLIALPPTARASRRPHMLRERPTIQDQAGPPWRVAGCERGYNGRAGAPVLPRTVRLPLYT